MLGCRFRFLSHMGVRVAAVVEDDVGASFRYFEFVVVERDLSALQRCLSAL
jgi:hypothetical protein